MMKVAGSRKTRILFVAHIESCFPELFHTALLLKISGRFDPYFLFDHSGYVRAMMIRDIERCIAEGIAVVNAPSLSMASSADGSRTHLLLRIFQFLKIASGARLGFFLRYNMASQLLLNILTLRAVRRIMRHEQASLLVLGLDLAHYNTAAYIKAAHTLGIPTALKPDIVTGPDEFGDVYFNNPRHAMDSIAKRIVGRLFPKWTMNYRGRRLLRLPSAGMVLAKEILELSPPLPWQIHSGHADAILLESEKVRAVAVKNGLEAPKLHVTGLSSHDYMAKRLRDPDTYRREVYARLGLEQDRPMILLALPQDDQPVGLQLPFPSYRDLITFLATSLAACAGYHTVVCLHPSTPADAVRHLEKHGVRITEEPTFSLIPLCHFYVATMSSTIKWAIACGKPVLSYDYNRQRKADFQDAKGVLVAEDQQGFLDQLRRLTDPSSYRTLAALQAESAPQWGTLDGRAGDRILSLFERLIADQEMRP